MSTKQIATATSEVVPGTVPVELSGTTTGGGGPTSTTGGSPAGTPGGSPGSAPGRRAPVQQRSRRRVEALLDAAERLVAERGVESLTTREIAEAAHSPVASLYQYFADKEGVLLALAERDMAEMDAEVAADVAALVGGVGGVGLTVASLVETVMRAFVAVYLRRPAFVAIYLRGRANPAVARFGRLHNTRVAATLRDLALGSALVGPGLTEPVAVLAVEVGDRVFQLAFETNDQGDPILIQEGIVMVTAYLERHATPAGLGR